MPVKAYMAIKDLPNKPTTLGHTIALKLTTDADYGAGVYITLTSLSILIDARFADLRYS